MEKTDIDRIRNIILHGEVVASVHFVRRMSLRHIAYEEVEYTILNGEVIEEYPEDYPHPSCLIFCLEVNGRPLHVVAALDNTRVIIVTAYEPTEDKWESDFKTRKRSNQS